jgi:hypothetical protein
MTTAIKYYDAPNGFTTIDYASGNYIQIDPFLTLVSPNKSLAFPGNASTYIKLHARTVEFSPTTLGSSKHVYTSIYYQDIIALANYFADWSCTYKIQEGSELAIEVDIPWDTVSSQDFTVSEFVSEQWEIIPNSDVKPLAVNGLLANPFLPPASTGNYIVLPDIMKIAVQNAYDNKFALTLPPNTVSSASLAPFLPYAQQILNYMRGGVEGVPSFTQTLKRTAVVDVRNTNRAFQKDVDFQRKSLNAEGTANFLLSTADLVNGYSVQATTADALYPSYCKQVTVTGLEAFQYYAYAGWLINPPHSKFITPNKIQLEQHFTWNEYLAGMYYIYSNPGAFPLVASAASNPQGFIPTP